MFGMVRAHPCSQPPARSSRATEVHPRVGALRAELLLDAQELVILRQALAAARRPCLDLARAQTNDQVRDEGVLGLARAMGDHDAPARTHGHVRSLDGLGD